MKKIKLTTEVEGYEFLLSHYQLERDNQINGIGGNFISFARKKSKKEGLEIIVCGDVEDFKVSVGGEAVKPIRDILEIRQYEKGGSPYYNEYHCSDSESHNQLIKDLNQVIRKYKIAKILTGIS